MKTDSAVTLIYFCNFLLNVNSKPSNPSEKIERTEVQEDFAPEPRIMGGQPANITNYPFIISMQLRYNPGGGSAHFCGGSYLLPRFILSAAHCMVKTRSSIGSGREWTPHQPRYFMAVGGSTRVKELYGSPMQIRLVDMVLPHPEYTTRHALNDIGCFRIESPFRITPNLHPSSIPSFYDDKLSTFEQMCVVIGWGKTSYTSNDYGDILRYVEVPLVTGENCKKYLWNHVQPDQQICAGRDEGGSDACQVDSGGPLVCNKTQVGVVSWGIGCGEPRSPGVYSRVDYHLKWLNETILRNVGHTDKDKSLYLVSLVIIIATIFCTCIELRSFI